MDRRGFFIVAFAGASAFAAASQAASDRVFTGIVSGVGAGGYDVVAYQGEARARKGDPALSAAHQGVEYRFATSANRDAFVADPERYLPRYGGYCAWAVSQGYTAKGDPEAWSIVDGRLYLNYSDGVRSRWLTDTAGHIAAGDRNWPKVLD